MNVLVLGSGGREHALSWKISKSSLVDRLYIAPGNAGTGMVGRNVDLALDDFDGIKKFVVENDVNMVVVGPEGPLVNGIHDYFLVNEELKNVPVIGPRREGAKLEGSKEFAKLFMQRHNIPTADFRSFTQYNLEEGLAYLDMTEPPYVLKADGLAAGKGVLILDDRNTAKEELTKILEGNKFGEAGNKVVIEEFLEGIELSVFVVTDGEAYKILPVAKDYKRIGEGDTGPNTGGMGAISPVPFADNDFIQKVEYRIIKPTIQGLQEDGIPYSGFIFFGLINVDGDPYVIEYNVRMGDPETEVVIPRIKSDIVELFEGITTNTLSERHIEIDERSAATIVLASHGYPDAYEKGKVISGTQNIDDALIFHAGTTEGEGALITSGGRVMAVTANGRDIEEAIEKANKAASVIQFSGKYYRKDIGHDLISSTVQA